jgi:peptidoglycan-associated lipoprotein
MRVKAKVLLTKLKLTSNDLRLIINGLSAPDDLMNSSYRRRSMKWLPFLLIIALMLLQGCGDTTKKAPDRGQQPASSGSVYDSADGGSSDSTEATLIDDDPDSFTAYTPDEPVESSEIGVIDQDEVPLDWSPILFEFDQSSLTESARARLEEYAGILKSRPELSVLLEGHCDIRGTENYNLALGERRAQSVKRFLISLGVDNSQLRTISYGELRPIDRNNNETAWAKNRRVAFTF